MKCAISRALIDRLRGEAESARDREICGLLLGEEGLIREAVPIANTAPDRARFFALDPAAHVRASREARACGSRVVGHYHSHPGGDATPSRADAAQAREAGAFWLILAATGQCLWRTRAGGAFLSAFDPVELEIS